MQAERMPFRKLILLLGLLVTLLLVAHAVSQAASQQNWLRTWHTMGGVSALLNASRNPLPPIYSVAAVRTHLIRSPGGWVGRTVRVRAVAGSSCVTWMGGANPACISSWPALLDPSVPRAEAALPLEDAPQPPLLVALQRLPLARWLVGSPQQVRWGSLTIYRVRLQAALTTVCGAPHCYEALLLDATSGSR